MVCAEAGASGNAAATSAARVMIERMKAAPLLRNSMAARFVAAGEALDPPCQQEDHKHDQDDPDHADPAMAVAIAVTTDAPAEAAHEKDDQHDDEYQAE
jgi:hypothetical protein